MCLKLRKKITNPFALVNLIMGLLLNYLCLLPTLERKFAMFWIYIYIYEKRKAHNMLSLMLDSTFKSLYLVSSFIGQEESVNVMDEYDTRSLYPMLLKCYHHLHPITKYIECIDQTIDEDCNLDIFQQIASISELTKELVTRKLFIFKCYQVDPKDIKCQEAMFLAISFLTNQILSIVVN